MINSTMFYYTTAIDKAFMKTSGSGVAFLQMSSMDDIWKVRLHTGEVQGTAPI